MTEVIQLTMLSSWALGYMAWFVAFAIIGASQDQSEKLSEVKSYVDFDAVVRMPEYTSVYYMPQPHYRKSATVLFWTPAYSDHRAWFWWFDRRHLNETCPELNCDFTVDRKKLDSADAVVFMVFSKTMNLDANISSQVPPYRLPNQRYVFFSIEPPRDNERLTKLNGGFFNWTMTYRRDSDVQAHFGKVVLQRKPLEKRQEDAVRDYAAGKTKLVAWFVSHCRTKGKREKFVEELRQYIPVDIYGRCGPHKCMPKGEKCFSILDKEYKFYLAFENTLCYDYVSEKFMEALGRDVVPVAFGGADYSQYAPPGSYIDALKFPSPKELAEYLHYLDSNPVEYNRYFDWKRGYKTSVFRYTFYACELCAKLLDRDQPPKSYDDIDFWWHDLSQCRTWNSTNNPR